MGAACCKRLETESPTASPHLPCCEVVRRCLRILCAVDPPQQKTVIRTRKYGLSDIVGPVVKKDGWAQTDPLPPPRRKKRKGRQRKRSRSLEFLPYLLDRRRASGSLDDIPGQEDAIDFQTYFMSRLPRDSIGDGKGDLYGRKKEFLSALLVGEENNNLVTMGFEEAAQPIGSQLTEEKQRTSDLAAVEVGHTDKTKQASDLGAVDVGDTANAESDSRRSSITESLREFESSLLEMLEEDECSLSKEVVSSSKDLSEGPGGEEEEEEMFIGHLHRGTLAPLEEEKEEEVVISPTDDDPEDSAAIHETSVVKQNGLKQSNLLIDNSSLESVIRTDSQAELRNENLSNGSLKSNLVLSDKKITDQPPTITVEIVS